MTRGPVLTLNNGVDLPAVGLGVYRSSPEETVGAMTAALDTGYRMIDTAAAYFKQAEVGAGIRASGVAREEIFGQTKAWISDYGEAQRSSAPASEASASSGWRPSTSISCTSRCRPPSSGLRLLAEGTVRSIGVCNFSAAHLDRLIAAVEVVPAVNQVEVHPFFAQASLRRAHARLGIVTQAWSPIGGVNRYWGDDVRPENDPLTHPAIRAIAERYGRTPGQVILRWQLQCASRADRRELRPLRLRSYPRGDVGDRSPRHRAPRRTRPGQSPAGILRPEDGIGRRADEGRFALAVMPRTDLGCTAGCGVADFHGLPAQLRAKAEASVRGGRFIPQGDQNLHQQLLEATTVLRDHRRAVRLTGNLPVDERF